MRKLWKNCQKKFKIQIEGEIEMCKKKIRYFYNIYNE